MEASPILRIESDKPGSFLFGLIAHGQFLDGGRIVVADVVAADVVALEKSMYNDYGAHISSFDRSGHHMTRLGWLALSIAVTFALVLWRTGPRQSYFLGLLATETVVLFHSAI